MEKIVSFKINHKLLKRGIYVSRKDYDDEGNVLATTFDIRMKEPNIVPAMNTAEVHTIEHLGATFLRNDEEYKKKTIYFGPMGCRTGFYVIFKGNLRSKDVTQIITRMFEFIEKFEGDIPGADEYSCGNYLDQNLAVAKYEAKKYLNEVLYNIKEENMVYPE